jgi:hypothetical protein
MARESDTGVAAFGLMSLHPPKIFRGRMAAREKLAFSVQK